MIHPTMLRPAATRSEQSSGPDEVSQSKRSLTIKRPHLIGELLIVIVLIKVYDYIRSLAEVRGGPALEHGREVLSLEGVLRLDLESDGNRWLADHDIVSLVAAYWYQFAHISVTLTVLAWCYIGSPTIYRRARNALVATNLVGMTVFFFLPVMPPRLLPDMDYIDSVAAAGFGSSHGGPVEADQYAAMPSLHLAWAVWTSLVAVALLGRYRGRLLCYLYPAVTAVVVVVTANHYVLDVVAGVAVALATTWVTGLLRPDKPALVSIRRPALRWRSWPGGSSSGRALGWIQFQMIRRRSRTANTNAPGSNGTQTVSSRYPKTAPSAAGEDTPTAAKAATRATSRAPMPPGEGMMADSEDTTT
jgi:membrane-associated phospholipid phosphatase